MAEQAHDPVDALARALPAQRCRFEHWRGHAPAFIPAFSLVSSGTPPDHAGTHPRLPLSSPTCGPPENHRWTTRLGSRSWSRRCGRCCTRRSRIVRRRWSTPPSRWRPGAAADQGPARCRRGGQAARGPNKYTVTLLRGFKCSPSVNVDRLKPCHSRAALHNPPDPGPASGQAGSPVREQLLNRTNLRGRPYFQSRVEGVLSSCTLAGPPLRRRLMGAGGTPRTLPRASRGVRCGCCATP